MVNECIEGGTKEKDLQRQYTIGHTCTFSLKL